MNFKNKLLTMTLILFLIVSQKNTTIYGSSFLDIPVWNENGTTEVSASLSTDTFLNIESESAILIEENTGEILFEKNSHQKLHPASITKIMTILLIMENLKDNTISLNDTVPCSENASSMGGSQIWLSTNETLTVEEMLKAICVVSANDCAVAMAEYISGSEEAFVILMNEKAKALGMNDTTFKNCHGIDEEGHITTAYDISLMSRELLQKHPNITKYTTIWMDSLRNGQSSLVNTNKLVRNYKGCTGLKTGSTSLALYNLSASATRDDLSLLAVVLKGGTSKIRFNDAKKLLDYGFTNFKFEKGATKDKVVQSITIDKSVEKELNLVYEKDSGVLVPKSSAGNIEQEIVINDKISAPIQKGEILGTVHFYLDGQILDSENLVAEQDITKLSVFSMYSYIIGTWMNLLR